MDEHISEAVTLTETLRADQDAGNVIRLWVDRIQFYESQGYRITVSQVDVDPARGRMSGQESIVLTVKLEREVKVVTPVPVPPVVPVIVPAPVIVTPVGTTGGFTIGDPHAVTTVTYPPMQTTLVPTSLIVSGEYGANMRDKPTLEGSVVLTKLAMGDSAPVSDMAEDSADFTWYHIEASGQKGWVREDNVRTNLQPAPAPNQRGAKYALPVPARNFTSAYDPTGKTIGYVHTGWDYADAVGTPVLATGIGTVVKIAHCAECGPAGISSVDKGYLRGDSRILNDEKWNYGYGHYVIMRYDWADLPDSTKQWLAAMGWNAANAFVMYAHLSEIKAKINALVAPGTVLGLMGNSGNSTGSHLHLEVRYSSDINPSWYKLTNRIADPVTLFNK